MTSRHDFACGAQSTHVSRSAQPKLRRLSLMPAHMADPASHADFSALNYILFVGRFVGRTSKVKKIL